VRYCATRSAFALSSVALMVLATAGCTQSSSGERRLHSDLSFIEQVQIDRNGNEVEVLAGPDPVDPAGDGKATCPPLSIAMVGALNGPNAALGIDIKNGIQLAVDKHNAANPGCQVQLKPFDTEGDAHKAREIAPQIVDDAYTIGLVGPAFSGEAVATGDVFDRAGLVAATASATTVTLAEKGWRTFFRGAASDAVQGPAVASYMKNTLGLRKVCVVDDSTDYGLGLAEAVRETLGPVADSACNIAVKRGDSDFAAVVTQITAAAADSVFFSGYYAEAAPFVQQLRDGGFGGVFVSADGTKSRAFVEQAGESSDGAVVSCPCSPATPEFAEEYSARFGQEPGTYSAEAYDLGTILLRGIDSGAITRPALLEFVRNYEGQGVAGKYMWTAKGERENAPVWMYKVS
jgi:branched-chain amino acid transport system substrate-binding protein